MIVDLFSLREREFFNTLQAIRERNFVIIGGYAVEAIFLKIGYNKVNRPKEIPHTGIFCRYEKNMENNFSVSMDDPTKRH